MSENNGNPLLKKRLKVKEFDGQKVHLRSLKLGAWLKADAMPRGDMASGVAFMRFVLSKSVTHEDGTPVFADENDPAFEDLDLDLAYELTADIVNLSNTGKLRTIEKNSEATT